MTSPKVLAPLIITRLQTITGLSVFDGAVGQVIKDNGITRPYAVLYMSPGNLTRERYCSHSGLWRVEFQVTVAGGNVTTLRDAYSQVIDVLVDHHLEPSNRRAEPISQDGDPGEERRDDSDPTDVRWYVPPTFHTYTTRS